MTDLERLIGSEKFDMMVITICFWVVLYVIVKILAVRAGVGDLLNQAYKRTGKLRKRCLQLRMLCTMDDPLKKLDRSVKVLGKVIKAKKHASKIMMMYLFDDKEDADVASAKALADGIPDLCRDAIVKVSEKNSTDVNAIFDKVESDIRTSRDLLKKAAAIDRKKELLQV